MRFEIISRFSGEVQFSAEIECADDTSYSVKLGLAVKVALKSGADLSRADLSRANLSRADLSRADLSRADLSGANLSGADLSWADLSWADLSRADLSGADLSRADLSGANLSGADLSWADLRQFKADFWMILTQNRGEVPGLINALCDGRVDGSSYSGECACLVGTIANIKHVPYTSLEYDSNRPAEQWFLMIRKGDKPGDSTGGGYANRMAVKWALEWCALNGITPETRWSEATAEPQVAA